MKKWRHDYDKYILQLDASELAPIEEEQPSADNPSIFEDVSSTSNNPSWADTKVRSTATNTSTSGGIWTNPSDVSEFEGLLRRDLIQPNQPMIAAPCRGQDIPMPSTSGVVSISEASPSTQYPALTSPLRFSQRGMPGPTFGPLALPPKVMQTHFTYPRNPINKCNEAVDFYIQGAFPDISADPLGFLVNVTSPQGLHCLVVTKLDQETKCRFISSFYPTIPGNYIVNVVMSGCPRTVHVSGSPFLMSVTRDYMDGLLQPRVIAELSRISPGLPVKTWGICVDRETEHIYITNKQLHQIHILNISGTLLHSFGEEGSGPGQLRKPTGIAVDQVNHRLIVSDKDNNRICIFTLDGQYMYSFGRPGHRNGDLASPWGVTVSPNGDLIAVSDFRNRRVQLFGKYGEFIKTRACGGITAPVGICFNNTGDLLYVSDYTDQTIIVMGVDMIKKGTLTAAATMQKPLGLVVDPAGNIVVCERNSIRIMAPSGHLLYTILATEQTFRTALDITVTNEGRLIFQDQTGRLLVY